jgi:hypothetical protein
MMIYKNLILLIKLIKSLKLLHMYLKINGMYHKLLINKLDGLFKYFLYFMYSMQIKIRNLLIKGKDVIKHIMLMVTIQ